MGVLMQAFYWDCPREDGQESTWWKLVESKLPELKEARFTALWLPPASKAGGGGRSMGYDVYDYYDLGKHDQKGSVKTWFGSEDELRSLIEAAHQAGIQVYADLVLNHNGGADAEELNPITNTRRWTKFTPKSGRFTRDWTCFHPSPYPQSDSMAFGDMPDLCHINPRVSTGILTHAKWLVEDVGFDGFRYDFVKGFGSWIVRAIHDRSYVRSGKEVQLFGVAECWDGDTFIDDWLDSVNRWSEHPVCAFDFPLRYRLKALCDTYGFSLRTLCDGGVLARDRPRQAVTFVDNHDFRDSEVVHDKMLAYAYILTHEGYPTVFWKDWFNYGLARRGRPDGIERLAQMHEQFAHGGSRILDVDDAFYAMERTGLGDGSGLLFGLANSGAPLRRTFKTGFAGKTLKARAWSGPATPSAVTAAADGTVTIEVPGRGYVVYA